MANLSNLLNSRKTKILLGGSVAIVAVLAVAYFVLSPLFVRPTNNFVFMHCGQDYCGNEFSVNPQGDISVSDRAVFSEDRATLHYYNTSDATVREMSFPEANLMQFDASKTSPDGYTVSDDDGLRVSKWIFSRQLPLPDELSGDSSFVGWVVE